MTYQSEKEKILDELVSKVRIAGTVGQKPYDEASHAIDELVKKWVIGEDELEQDG